MSPQELLAAQSLARGRAAVGTSFVTGSVLDQLRAHDPPDNTRRNWLIFGGLLAVAAAGIGGWYYWQKHHGKKKPVKPAEKAANRFRRHNRRQAKRRARTATKVSNKGGSKSKAAYRLKPTMDVQTLIFPKGKFTQDQAVTWAREHDFKTDKVDETGSSFRIRQQQPGRMGPRTFRTIPFGDSGIKAVVAKKKVT